MIDFSTWLFLISVKESLYFQITVLYKSQTPFTDASLQVILFRLTPTCQSMTLLRTGGLCIIAHSVIPYGTLQKTWENAMIGTQEREYYDEYPKLSQQYEIRLYCTIITFYKKFIFSHEGQKVVMRGCKGPLNNLEWLSDQDFKILLNFKI